MFVFQAYELSLFVFETGSICALFLRQVASTCSVFQAGSLCALCLRRVASTCSEFHAGSLNVYCV